MHYKIMVRFATAVCISLFLVVPSVSLGQQILEEIIVTAQKREESLQDTSLAITAFSGATLDRAGVVDIDTLAEMIPNVDVDSEANRDGLIITIRGIAGTDVRNGADPTTAFHVDGNYVPRLSGANAYFFDTERVEVLRGPQGTLYGRNSTSGVINVISKKPVLGETGGNAEVIVGNYSQFVAKGAVNFPISDNVAVRASFMSNTRDGYVKNDGPGSNGRITDDSNDADELAFRAHLLWEISPDTSVLFTGEHYERNGVGLGTSNIGCLSEAQLATYGLTTATPAQPNGADVVCNDSDDPADNSPFNTQGFRNNNDDNYRLELNHHFGFADFFYQGAYRNHFRDFLDDNDFTTIVANGIESDSFIKEISESETWSHEIRFSSNNEGPLQWIAGAFYMEETIDGIFQVNLARDPSRNAGMAPGPVRAFGFDEQVVQFIDKNLTNESIATFLNTSYDISDTFTLRGGARWTRDEKNKGGNFADPSSGSTFCVFFNNNGTNGNPTGSRFNICGASGEGLGGGGGIPQVSNPSWTKVTWNVGLDWHVNDDLLAYFKVSTGFKSGGWNRGSQGTTSDGTLFVFDPEEVVAYEAGIKWDLMGGRARLNLAAFYYDYTNMQQAAIFTNPVDGTRTNITFNAAESEIFGLEAEGSLLFGDSGSVNVSLGFIDTEFKEFIGFQDDFTGASLDVTGNELPRSPGFNGTVSLIPMTFEALNGTWTPQVQFHYESSSFFSVANRSIGPNEAGVRDSYTKTNLTLGYEHSGGKWYAEAFIYNLENDDIFNSSGCSSAVGSASSLPNPVFNCSATFQAPRTFGLRVGFKL